MAPDGQHNGTKQPHRDVRMEKLTDFQLLECAGRWHKSATDAGLDVVVKIDKSLLTLVGKDDRVIVVWTLDAIQRTNPGSEPGEPAFYSPDDEGMETVEISDPSMISVIDDIISKYVEPEIGSGLSVRGFMLFLALVAVVATLLFAFSGSIAQQMAGLVSAKERQDIGERILAHFLDANGRACGSAHGARSLNLLDDRLFGSGKHELMVVPTELVRSLMLPGSKIILGSSLLEVHDGPEVIAGYALAESVAAEHLDPFERFLRSAGLRVAVYLALGKGADDDVIKEFAASVPVSGPTIFDEAELLAKFEGAGFTSAPFARASGRNGPLEAGDPFPNIYEPLLSDGDWLRLRDICLE